MLLFIPWSEHLKKLIESSFAGEKLEEIEGIAYYRQGVWQVNKRSLGFTKFTLLGGSIFTSIKTVPSICTIAL